ncbi:peroxisomal multifunctional enzyme type 2-like [Cimex lectularius]|uniref:Peroxisomal multifunctional enzyme type 2 n=1 Tax=Cimex lectularius TaxID=79782 RepID=A0A8I6SPY8_CIMLE|nr:peroxisomal multifunctional enzyme type 2-like [Cimex lectularius]
MEKLRFDGKVVIVTGAGAGLGRAYALLFGSRGASVVVNDLGSTRSGDGSSSKAADAVVEEIKKMGGKAVGDYNSVVDGDKIVQTALENFGRIDVVVNNAGILRDKSFARISNADWDLIHDVHLKGTFKTTQAAWPHFRKQNYGRVIVTASNSGLYGNFGQANYSAAKMGVVGLCKTLAIEGRKNNINCNVIVPTAASRLTEDILPPEFFKELKPELIAPVVVWLCHEDCSENGSVIESAAGWATKYSLVRGPGAILRKSMEDVVTPEEVQANWEQVTDLTTTETLGSIEEATGGLMTQMERMKSGDVLEPKHEEEYCLHLNHKDCIVFALGIGASITNPNEVKFLYENDEKFSAFPTMAIIPGQLAVMTSPLTSNAIPGRSYDLSQILHGEQYLELFKPLPTTGVTKSKCKLIEVLDKGKNAVFVVGVETFDENNDKICYGEMTVVVVNAGGFGGLKESTKCVQTQAPPSRKPDHIVEEKIGENQAVMYRLSGDSNPLHIDPSFASIAGYEKPILHGLCSLGFSARHVLNTFAEGDPSCFKAIKVRFAKPTYPGEVLRTEMWKEGNRIHFQSISSNATVISGAYVDLHQVLEAAPRSDINDSSLESNVVFQKIGELVKGHNEVCKKINGVFLYKILSQGEEAAIWTVDLISGKVYKGLPEPGVNANTTLILEDNIMVKMALGQLNPQTAFMKGMLKIKGNIMLAQKLKDLMILSSKL